MGFNAIELLQAGVGVPSVVPIGKVRIVGTYLLLSLWVAEPAVCGAFLQVEVFQSPLLGCRALNAAARPVDYNAAPLAPTLLDASPLVNTVTAVALCANQLVVFCVVCALSKQLVLLLAASVDKILVKGPELQKLNIVLQVLALLFALSAVLDIAWAAYSFVPPGIHPRGADSTLLQIDCVRKVALMAILYGDVVNFAVPQHFLHRRV